MPCGLTRNGALLLNTPFGVAASTSPVVAPTGTAVVIKEGEATVNGAAVPLKATLVAPVRLVPRIFTDFPQSRGQRRK